MINSSTVYFNVHVVRLDAKEERSVLPEALKMLGLNNIRNCRNSIFTDLLTHMLTYLFT